MKKLILLFVAAVAFAACSPGDDPDPNAPTTFVFIHNFENFTIPNCVVGYYSDGLCHKIADLGDMTAGKPTPEVTLTDDAITEIRLFTEYENPVNLLRRSFPISKNIKNVFELQEDDYSDWVDKNDPTQYPH